MALLDAFIIERIRREEEARRQERIPLRIEREPPRSPPPRPRDDADDAPRDRGVVIIEFTAL